MSTLRCFLFSDLLPEERACVEPCLEELGSSFNLQRIEVTEYHKSFFTKQLVDGPSWILAHDWQKALNFLSVKKSSLPVFVSVFSTSLKKITPIETWIKSFQHVLPRGVRLIAHSPMSFKFLRDLAGVPELQLENLPLPVPHLTQERKSQHFTVGTYSSFRSENNLHFVATLAHYLSKKDPDCFFRIFGFGPLYQHLNQLTETLGISKQVTIIETMEVSDVAELDVLLYVPHRNDHFIPLLLAASAQVVPVCIDTPGINDYVVDSQTGFVVPQEDTKTMAELILTLKQHPLLRKELSKRFSEHVQTCFNKTIVCSDYAKLFGGVEYQTKNYVRRSL